MYRSTHFSGKYAVKREELLITIRYKLFFEFSDLHAHYVYVVNNKIDGCLTPHIFAAFILVFGWRHGKPKSLRYLLLLLFRNG